MTTDILNASHLAGIRETTLFYPCAGDDLLKPIDTFAPYCHTFWFVDIGYFRNRSPEDHKPVLRNQAGYSLLDVQIRLADLPESEWISDCHYGYKPPPIRSERSLHLPTGREIVVHRHRRRGPSALRKEVGQLGVFFYRGDSDEGGSATHWLTVSRQRVKKGRKPLIHEVLERLTPGGLFVTDGSMCKWPETNPYGMFRRLIGKLDISNEEAMSSMSAFNDGYGWHFECAGCIGQSSKGPTIVWRVNRSTPNTVGTASPRPPDRP